MNIRMICFLLILSCLRPCISDAEPLFSPSGRLQVRPETTDSELTLHIVRDGHVYAQINVGLHTSCGDATWSRASAMETTKNAEGLTDEFREYRLPSDNGRIALMLRISDNTAAFRYRDIGIGTTQLSDEASTWRLPERTRVWFFERENGYKLKSYAGSWTEAGIEELPTISRQGPVQGTPLILRFSDGRYGLLAEAALCDYSGLRLKAIGDNSVRADFTEGAAGFPVEAGWSSPWRIFLIADDLDALINQRAIEALSPSPDPALFADQTYIIPGKSAWRWFSRLGGDFRQERKIEIGRAHV